MTLPTFGMTSPCAEIAKHFGVSQSYVDHAMEWALHEAGIRKRSPGLAHADRLQVLANEIPFERRIRIGLALNQVIEGIKLDATRRRFDAAAEK